MIKEQTYTAHQPLLFPALYMCNRVAHVHAWACMGSAQFTHNSGQNTAVMLDRWGKRQKITVPVVAGRKPITQTLVVDPRETLPRMFESLRHLYSKATYWSAYAPHIEHELHGLRRQTDLTLHMLTTALERVVFSALELHSLRFEDTELGPRGDADASAWIAQMGVVMEKRISTVLVTSHRITRYLCGATSLNDGYLDKKAFADRGILPVAQNFKMAEYTRFASTKLAHLSADATVSVLDPLFHLGGPETLRLISTGCV